MNLNFRRLTICCSLMAIILLLGGCKNTSPALSSTISETSSIPESFSSASTTPESASTGVTNANELKNGRLEKELADNLILDAEVILPDQQEYAQLSVQSAGLGAKDIWDIFMPGQAYDKMEEDTEMNRIDLYSNSDIELIFHPFSFYYSCNDSRNNQINNIYNFEIRERKNMSKQDELSFSTMATTQDQIAKLVKDTKCAFSLAPNPVAYTLTHEEMNQLQEKMEAEGVYEDGMKVEKIPDLSAKDDSYFLRYAFNYNGTPIYNELDYEANVSVRDESVIIWSFELMARITSDGIQEFNLSAPLGAVTPGETQAILTLDQAVEAFSKIYADQILTSPVTVTKIWLEYIPIPDDHLNTSYTLTPYWCFTTSLVGGPDGVFYHTDRLNAFTGDDLAYGG